MDNFQESNKKAGQDSLTENNVAPKKGWVQPKLTSLDTSETQNNLGTGVDGGAFPDDSSS